MNKTALFWTIIAGIGMMAINANTARFSMIAWAAGTIAIWFFGMPWFYNKMKTWTQTKKEESGNSAA